jgi:hypothetical protein
VGHASWGTWYFLGKTYSKIELIIILKMSEIDCFISCAAFMNITLATTRLSYSVKSFLQTLHILHSLKSITNSSCFLDVGQHCQNFEMLCLPAASHLKFLATAHTFATCLFTVPYHCIVAICCCIGSMLNSHTQNHFW